MIQEQWQFPASNGEGDIYARAWLPPSPIAIVQISHGMSEHSARYDEFARFLCTKGFAVVANDHAGHGLSAQGHFGAYSATAGGFDCCVNDLHRLFELAEDKVRTLPYDSHTPRAPRILIGHSMGSIMAALFAERYHGLDALVMCATPAAIGFSRVFQMLAGIIAATHGQLTRSPMLERLGGTVAHLPLEERERIRTWLTRDTEKVREFCVDPLCGFDYTAGGYYAMFQAYHHVYSPCWGQRMPDIPILVIAGAEDISSNLGKGSARYEAKLTNAGLTQVTCKLFEGCRHEILNEINRQEVFEFISNWLTNAKQSHANY